MKYHHSSHNCFNHGGLRRGFLLVDALAGTALAVIALGLILWVLSADMKIRNQQLQNQQMILAAENLMQRLEGVPFAELGQARVDAIAAEYQKQAGVPGLSFQVKLAETGGEPALKRLTLQGRAGALESMKIMIWRDRYPMVPGK